MSVPTLETLLHALAQVELQATALLVTERSGSTHYVCDEVLRESGRLSDSVREEIAAMRRWKSLLEAK